MFSLSHMWSAVVLRFICYTNTCRGSNRYVMLIKFIFSLSVNCRAFETGVEQRFSFVNDVNLYELKSATESSIGYRISGNINVGVLFGNENTGFLLRFEVMFKYKFD